MNRTIRNLALAAGALFAGAAAVDIPHTQSAVFAEPLDYVVEGLFAIALTAAATVLWLLAKAARGITARAGWSMAAAGTSAMAVTAAATLVMGRETLDLLMPLGLLGLVIGYIVLVVADLCRWIEPRFAGLVLAAATVGMIALGEGYGHIAWAAGWFAVAGLLQPARVQERTQPVAM